jgi:hypothetical protein
MLVSLTEYFVSTELINENESKNTTAQKVNKKVVTFMNL